MPQFNISEDSLYSLLGDVVENIKKQEHLDSQNKWISKKDAIQMLGASFETLAREGKIFATCPKEKTVLYDYESIKPYLKNTHGKNQVKSQMDDYLTGFNDGYLIKKYRPNVSMKFEGLHPTRTEYYKGLKDCLVSNFDRSDVIL